MKKIIYVTGSRAEYGVMRNLLGKLDKDHDFELSIIVTGMHLMKEFGNTIDEIKKEKVKIAGEVDMKLDDNTNSGMSKAIGYGILGITDILEKNKPDLVMLAGDRGEMLATAIASAHLNIPIAHISGGDTTAGATVDERIRHALTKFADIHFPANENSAKKIIEIGENKRYVFPVGNPGIPMKYGITDKKMKEAAKKYKLDITKPMLLVIQHPVTTQVQKATSQMKETMEALMQLKMQAIVIYPNSDAGSKDMIKVIHAYEDIQFIQIHKNINRDDFQDLMALSSVLVGNSSCALLEAPSFNLPAVNIGTRQEGREHSSNIINVAHNKNEIIKAIKTAMTPSFRNKVVKSQSPYAKENPEDAIIKILKELDFQKVIKEKFKHD
jgi:UDP-hydrolysing UDP-N-acetyl-D-glucosamine 2-epimerase